ncbi:uncharacterized protein LOC125943332 isoform X1 [Dermacentor silvarum]|uniref:uncharacterized protein LOC125943332 isoform X1 n=2 Tax=Dermacentor silvarum TaxID=543639 RepID=UPI00210142F9|nr:uncharacterized protein LOC125943332 isoform X1 [Dermacentor silvarum]
MCWFALRFAARCLAIAIFTVDTSKADVSCTDDPGNTMCQVLSSNKGNIEDRRGYYTEGQQDPVNGPMSLEMLSSSSFQSPLDSLSENDMPLWLMSALGLDKRPDTVTLYRGPSGFVVNLLPPQTNLYEDGTIGDFASGNNQQMPKASRQLTQMATAGAQPASRKKVPWQYQTQQQKAVQPKGTKAYSPVQSYAVMPLRNSVPTRKVQAANPQQSSAQPKLQSFGFGLQGNAITKWAAGAGTMGPQSAGQQATAQQMWLNAQRKMHDASRNQNRPSQSTLMAGVGGNQEKQIGTNSAMGQPVPSMRQPTTAQWFQQPFPGDSARNQRFGTVSAEPKQRLPQGAYLQAATNGLQSTTPTVPLPPFGPGQYPFQHSQRQAAVTAPTSPNASPSQIVTGMQDQMSGYQSQTNPQSIGPDAERQQNGGTKTTMQQQFPSSQQILAGASTQQSSPSSAALATPQQQRDANVAQNSTQGPALSAQVANGVTAAPTEAAKQEGSSTAGTPTNESVAPGMTAAQTPTTQKQLTEQQEALRRVGITPS